MSLPLTFTVAVLMLAAACRRPVAHEPQWYEGGNLHQATLREWCAATDANRLATAADFAATILKAQNLSVGQLRLCRARGRERWRSCSASTRGCG